MMIYDNSAVCVSDEAKAEIRGRLNAGETTTVICEAMGITGLDVREEMLSLQACGHPRFVGQVIPEQKMFARIGLKPFASKAEA